MTGRDAIAVLPILIPAYAGVLLMGLIAFVRSARLSFWFTIVATDAAFLSIFLAYGHAPRTVGSLIRVDDYSLFFSGLIIASAHFVTLLCGEYLKSHEKRSEAFYVLLLFAITGMLVIVSSAHFLAFFLGLETLSASLYGLIGYTRRQRLSLEAAIKYLVLAAASSAFLLFGIALIYADSGTMIFARFLFPGVRGSLVSFFGLGLIAVGVGFKLAWVPFHMWSPDVYQGAPAPVTALIASASKGAVFELVLRLTAVLVLPGIRHASVALTVLAVATMFTGNLLALSQTNLKRLLAYSSIAQMGYLLIPVLANSVLQGVPSAIFYLVSYMAAAIAAFGVIAVVSARRELGDVEQISDYTGLSARNPGLAAVLALALLSLTGMPLTAGFFAKFYIFSAAANAGLWWLLVVGVINTGMSAFYYLRAVFALYSHRDSPSDQPTPGSAFTARLSLAICAAAVILFGIYPTPLVRFAEAAAHTLGF